MTFGFDSAILLISSYANPVETLHHARQQGYQVTDFMVTPMPFGYYSSEPKVCEHAFQVVSNASFVVLDCTQTSWTSTVNKLCHPRYCLKLTDSTCVSSGCDVSSQSNVKCQDCHL